MEIMKVNTFCYVAGALLVTSAIAAFMSTSDSIVLAASNQATMDIWVNLIGRKTNAAPSSNLIVGKIFSISFMYFAVFGGVHSGWDVDQLLQIGACHVFSRPDKIKARPGV